jgi:hypothetical protein
VLPPLCKYSYDGTPRRCQFHWFKELHRAAFVNGRFNDPNPFFAAAPALLPVLPSSLAITIRAFFHPACPPDPFLIRRIGLASSRIDGANTPELVVALCYGKELCFLLAIDRYGELALTARTVFVGP